MKMISNPSTPSSDQRSGAAHILIAAMLFTFLVVAAMTVDTAYMQLIRTELRTATDAAAKAGAEALVRTQDGNAAKAAAVQYANLNKVGGQPFRISQNDVTLGRVTGQNNGSWTFAANSTPAWRGRRHSPLPAECRSPACSGSSACQTECQLMAGRSRPIFANERPVPRVTDLQDALAALSHRSAVRLLLTDAATARTRSST